MATTYSKITYDGKKVQVDSAVRDGNGKQIDTNYQEKLVSGNNIKTVNGNSLLGSGDITIQSGGGNTEIITVAQFKTGDFDIQVGDVLRFFSTGTNNNATNPPYFTGEILVYRVTTSGNYPLLNGIGQFLSSYPQSPQNNCLYSGYFSVGFSEAVGTYPDRVYINSSTGHFNWGNTSWISGSVETVGSISDDNYNGNYGGYIELIKRR